jgi:subtilisin family serine protease
MKKLLGCFGAAFMMLVSGAAWSEDKAPVEVLADQWILTVPNSELLAHREMQRFVNYLGLPATVMESDRYSVLLDIPQPSSGGVTAYGTILDDEQLDLCMVVRAAIRIQKRARIQEGRPTNLPRFSCAANGIIRNVATSNDPMLSSLWGMQQGNDIDIDAPEAWDVHRGSRGVVVAVIDTGIDHNHPDLVANMWRNPGEVAGNNIDDDGNGVIDDVHGYNAITQSGNPFDDNGHGTHCAGTIGGVGNNGQGVVGVNWAVQLMAVKMLAANGSGDLYAAIRAVDYVTNMKARGVPIVLSSNSWGWYGPSWTPLRDAIQRAQNGGLLFVAAAGNDGSSNQNPSQAGYPASYDLPNIISVAAVDSQGSLANFSNFGETAVDIAAPGVSIASTYPGNQYRYLSGTSMATPHVAGALALLKAASSALDWQALRDYVFNNSATLNSLNGRVAGARFLNINQAVRAAPSSPLAENPTPPATATPTASPTATNTRTSTPTATPIVPPTATMTPTPTPTAVPGNYVLSGSVVSSGGVTVPGVALRIQVGATTQTVQADSNGGFQFSPIWGPAAYSLTAVRAGYVIAPVAGSLDRDRTIVVSASQKTVELTVKAFDAAMAPVSGVTVNVVGRGELVTNGQGEVRFQLPWGSSYTAVLSGAGFRFPRNLVSGEIFGDSTRAIVALR